MNPENPTFEFHISRKAREKYDFAETLFSLTGAVVFPNFYSAHLFADRFNQARADEEKVSPADLFAMGLLDEIMHFLFGVYRKSIMPDLFSRLEHKLKQKLGEKAYLDLIATFVSLFPDSKVFNGNISAKEYVKKKTNRRIALEEMLILWLENRNPAYRAIEELIGEDDLKKKTPYKQAVRLAEDFFKQAPPFGKEKLPLPDFLLLPAKKFPNSISAQLEYIRENWSDWIAPLLSRLLIGIDFIREERMARFGVEHFGPGPTQVTEFGEEVEYEPEQFSPDLDWMPRLVLIAKSTYVWLDQLSKQYAREITRLDQIPDEELDRLAAYGFTGLWLIGVWERSKASQKIKQMRGNPEAVASAYSLYDYVIAQDLGGEEAYRNLKERAWRRGIRLASDMVPNHMGIDSRWVIQHPDWFIQLKHSPFPGYSFTGPDLCEDERVSVFIEDGYWNQTDAAVVFKRVDNDTGETRYIYHGNDGTSMPWNDTAQLNYLLPEVREAVIQTILHVARKFPIIRFDAAMTLAKRHFQRLWFPLPGSGGDIPSRAEHAMTKEEFNRRFPKEFWREVVDRVQQEVPDTLLLAEAFWMMEGYFVRTLGMHRVYNSAFMNMLKNEENEKYRLSIKNVLEFNPQILKRYVNFMNNPDEETAVAQFGKDDKYFGVCIMMATMPGLPMFGHGQIEGFTEKYGMEYRRAYWDEKPDAELIARHEREVFPLLRKRYLFSDVENFYLYDFYRADGGVNENVFAYSNRFENEKALVVYNNKFEHAAGFVRTSAAYRDGDALKQKSLVEGLDLHPRPGRFVLIKEHISGLEFLRDSVDLAERGLYVGLGAFKYQVFYGFQELDHSPEAPYGDLFAELNGAGVASVDTALKRMIYRPLIQALEQALTADRVERMLTGDKAGQQLFTDAIEKLWEAAAVVEKVAQRPKLKTAKHLKNLRAICRWAARIANPKTAKNFPAEFVAFFRQTTVEGGLLIARLFLQALDDFYRPLNISFVYGRHLNTVLEARLQGAGVNEAEARQWVRLLEISLHSSVLSDLSQEVFSAPFWQAAFDESAVAEFLEIHRYEGVAYFNKEAFEMLAWWVLTLSLLAGKTLAAAALKKRFKQMNQCIATAGESGYQVMTYFKLIAQKEKEERSNRNSKKGKRSKSR